MEVHTLEEFISVRGARLHNLKNVSVDIPHNQLTVVTGVSGSGKSSLAFDTIYAEGQRRYVESLSAYARQFLERMEKPEVDEIDGIAPAIAIRQKNTTRNPRSTVATTTECYDFLRLLFARVGQTFCPDCGTRVDKDTVDHVAARLMQLPEGTRFLVMFPVIAVGGGDNALKEHLFDLRKKGFTRLYQGGNTFEFSTPESLLDIDFAQPVYALVDRIALNADIRQRLVDTVEICYREAREVIFQTPAGEQLRFSEQFTCKTCNRAFQEPQPTLFSFNSPAGACPRCQGFGNTIDFSPDLVVPNRLLTIEEGALEPFTKPKASDWYAKFKRSANGRVRLDVPFCDLSAEEQEVALGGVREFFAFLETKKYKLHVRVFLSRYRGYARCPVCHGARLRAEALYVKVSGQTITQVVARNIADAYTFIGQLHLTPEESSIADKVLVEIRQRLKFLNDVGLEYLTLDRLSSTLSGGEAQRIQLATCLGSRLVGSCYVLDEPSIGLHSRDTNRLIHILHELRDLGNTILVVEHDPDVMQAADHIIDMGPGAGELGGQVIFEGSYKQLRSKKNTSLTGRYLREELQVVAPRTPRPPDPKRMLHFAGARLHNLKNVDVDIPLERMVVVTGVSGSGKSTLVHDVIYRALSGAPDVHDDASEEQPLASGASLNCRRVDGAAKVRETVMIDQSPIGRTPRSNPITYVKAFDIIRGLLAATKEAEKHGYGAGHFSFNIPGGRCETCQGDGTVTVEMQFLADVELVCDECKGTRFKASTLEIRYKNRNVHEILQLTIREALEMFYDTPRLVTKLKVLDDVGLGYLRLGQSATTLSGGEAQRVKLAARLADSSTSNTLFIFDEPTTGLHFDDIAKLLAAFDRLLEGGASVLIIEHNLEVIRAADWVIDLGPDGGEAGGRIVATGTPEDIMRVPESHTGRYLAELLAVHRN
jgi:excinuclease ABC subunit A